jgi:hypothetical protein
MDLVKNLEIGNNLTDNQVPIVGIPGLNADILNQLYQQAVILSPHYQKSDTYLWENWYSQPHSRGWQQFIIRDNDQQKNANFLGEDYYEIKKSIDDDGTVALLVDELFKPFGLTVTNARFKELTPGGYICPHADLYEADPGLIYFWIPLHTVSPHLKIFPWGWHKPKFGSMYLFNISKWVHSAYNNESYTRYALNGRFEINSVSDLFIKKFQENKNLFQQDFENLDWGANYGF